jgi:hypothetical protein
VAGADFRRLQDTNGGWRPFLYPHSQNGFCDCVSNRHFECGAEPIGTTGEYIAVVNLAGKDIYLDPGTRFCPYGYLRWIRTSTMGFTPDKKGGVFVTAKASGYDKAITRRTAEMALDSDGNLNGATMVKFEGGDTLEHQLDEMETDEREDIGSFGPTRIQSNRNNFFGILASPTGFEPVLPP